MNPIYFSIGVLATLSILAMPLALALESTQLDTNLIGNSVIDVRAEEGQRIVHVYAEFDNFDISEKYFNVNVIQSESGDTVSNSQVNVYSTSNGLINFGSMVGYSVNDRDLCSYDMSEAAEDAVCNDVMTGDYEIEITTKDGSVAAYEQIKIIDSEA
jgi:hypothetical protein